ncbi:MAG: Na(+)-translocating NADH-quinone reductase subunit A [Bacteroidales bacterium]|nr:Na(+)-translocating NADH-quinone reductase subunit A [Bacteroidales bacterium]MBD5257422.1 Na(+)-translocating NADH-quinone reductase subunit A [Barnesiella sp.]
MSRKLTIKKGLDIRIAGGLGDAAAVDAPQSSTYGIIPDDFLGFVPKPSVKEGDKVKVGDPLLYDKRDSELKLVSPVEGTVTAIVRGERRKIMCVTVTPDGDVSKSAKAEFDTKVSDADSARRLLKNSGLWAMMRQRPYDIVPNPDAQPRDIFVTAIDSAPLAADPVNYYNDIKALEAGVALLALTTKGKIYVGRRDGSKLPDIKGAEMVDIDGPHPAGNAGVLIANIAPVNKGETVWTLDIATLWRMGRLMLTGTVDTTTYVALTGSEVADPKVYKAVIGATIASLTDGKLRPADHHQRIISGNVLTGITVAADGYLRYPYRQITVIPEGDDVDEFMGWASISPSKMSESRTFPGKFLKRLFRPDARLKGGRRAFIMSGEYDRYMPMDIMAEYLLKAIIGRDIEKMEKLGIYEVAPEDFALGEFADTSKIEAQKIVREGLDFLRKEVE